MLWGGQRTDGEMAYLGSSSSSFLFSFPFPFLRVSFEGGDITENV